MALLSCDMTEDFDVSKLLFADTQTQMHNVVRGELVVGKYPNTKRWRYT